MDSTTITLFKEILKGCGRNPKEGKKKGGIKAHTIMEMNSRSPALSVTRKPPVTTMSF
jgi:hypothetical protein